MIPSYPIESAFPEINLLWGYIFPSQFQVGYGDISIVFPGKQKKENSIHGCKFLLRNVLEYLNESILFPPQEQKWIIGVLFMVPVYAAESVSTR